jgi:predicted CoA-binding protein
MSDATQTLEATRSILIIDWPSRDVPDSLARAGYAVTVKGGPGPEDYSAYKLRDGEVVASHVGRAPDQVNLVYSHRPLTELPGILGMATELGAQALWCQSGLADAETNDPKGCWVSEEASGQARQLVEAAGLRYVDDVYIGDAVRELGARTDQ